MLGRNIKRDEHSVFEELAKILQLEKEVGRVFDVGWRRPIYTVRLCRIQKAYDRLTMIAPISKFHCFHETKQTQNEVSGFCDSPRILATFAQFCLNSLFAT